MKSWSTNYPRFPCEDCKDLVKWTRLSKRRIFLPFFARTLISHSTVTRVTFEEKSNFKYLTSVKLAFLNFSWGAVYAWLDSKIFCTQLILFQISWFIWCDSRDRLRKGVSEITWFEWLFIQTCKSCQNNFLLNWEPNTLSRFMHKLYTVPSLLCLCVVACRKCYSCDTTVWLVACRKCDLCDTTVWLVWHSSTLNSNTYLYLASEETNCNISKEKFK